jgi:DNA repair protein RadC
MAERLYQLRFDIADSDFEISKPRDVTPLNFESLPYPIITRDIPERLPVTPAGNQERFIREAVERFQITSPDIAAEYLQTQVFHPFEDCKQEELWVLCLNTRNLVTHDSMIYRGNVNSTMIRPIEVFRPAIILNSTAMIISHCHPSGSPEPSPEDIQITRYINDGARLLGIEFLDHLIIGNQRWVSLKEQGLGFD